MVDNKVQAFIELAGQKSATKLQTGTAEQRKLGAQLLLSEVLEYIISGLGVTPEFNGTKITDANALTYSATTEPDLIEMVDGLADTAYTMYWNSVTFGVPLEQAYDMVCDNNLEKFVSLDSWTKGVGAVEQVEWNFGKGVNWPAEVTTVEVIDYQGAFYAVGKDKNGKVRKPSSYAPLNLSAFVEQAIAR
ncbi:hypothetical protein JNK13_00815 [bacterium]|nr:hypothetical protein [bacterium]